jgi:hypothetical protein
MKKTEREVERQLLVSNLLELVHHTIECAWDEETTSIYRNLCGQVIGDVRWAIAFLNEEPTADRTKIKDG